MEMKDARERWIEEVDRFEKIERVCHKTSSVLARAAGCRNLNRSIAADAT